MANAELRHWTESNLAAVSSRQTGGEPAIDVTTVHLVRHGEVRNDAGVVYGRLPGFHLSQRGRLMAISVSGYLQEREIVVVVASPLERAVETAEEIARPHGLTVGTDDRLIEAANAFEGTRFGLWDSVLRHPSRLRCFVNPLRPTWGEPYSEQVTRMHAALDDVRRAAAGRSAVIVSHQAPIWALRRSLEGNRVWTSPGRRACSLASVTSLTFDGPSLRSVDYVEPFSDR